MSWTRKGKSLKRTQLTQSLSSGWRELTYGQVLGVVKQPLQGIRQLGIKHTFRGLVGSALGLYLVRD